MASWARMADGSWGVRAEGAVPGDSVIVTRRDGSASRVTLGDDHGGIYAVAVQRSSSSGGGSGRGRKSSMRGSAMSAATVEERLAADGRVAVGGPQARTRQDRGGIELGSIHRTSDGGRWMVVSVGAPHYRSAADCEMEEDCGQPGLEPGWETPYTIQQVSATEAEIAADSAAAQRRADIDIAAGWRSVETLVGNLPIPEGRWLSSLGGPRGGMWAELRGVRETVWRGPAGSSDVLLAADGSAWIRTSSYDDVPRTWRTTDASVVAALRRLFGGDA